LPKTEKRPSHATEFGWIRKAVLGFSLIHIAYNLPLKRGKAHLCCTETTMAALPFFRRYQLLHMLHSHGPHLLPLHTICITLHKKSIADTSNFKGSSTSALLEILNSLCVFWCSSIAYALILEVC